MLNTQLSSNCNNHKCAFSQGKTTTVYVIGNGKWNSRQGFYMRLVMKIILLCPLTSMAKVVYKKLNTNSKLNLPRG